MAPEGQKPSQWLYLTQLPREMYSQPIVHKALSWGTVRKSACILAEITIQKSQESIVQALQDMSIEELQSYRDRIRQQWKGNQHDYEMRYGNAPANYASSISDDYNGDGEEFTRLTLLLQQIDVELQRRPRPGRNM